VSEQLAFFEPESQHLSATFDQHCLDCGRDTYAIGEYYMLHDRVWLTANPGDAGMLCVGCVESRLGRALSPADFADAPVNRVTWIMGQRLRARLGKAKP